MLSLSTIYNAQIYNPANIMPQSEQQCIVYVAIE